MNLNTVVTVHGYQGDIGQIKAFLPLYRHHETPLLILSPENSKIGYESFSGVPNITCWAAGAQQYIGHESLVRQKLHLQLALRFPHEFFLLNDADSFCVSPKIPRYVYDSPDTLWSNVVSDEMHARPEGYEYPRLAFQPPYFCHRSILEKLVSVADTTPTDPKTPFVDWVMMAWAVRAGVHYRNFSDGVSCPTRAYAPGTNLMRDRVRQHGAVFLHSVKEWNLSKTLALDRKEFLRSHPTAPR